MAILIEDVECGNFPDNWGYRAIDSKTGRTLIEGRAEKIHRNYHLFVGPTKDKMKDLGGTPSRDYADNMLITIIDERASRLDS